MAVDIGLIAVMLLRFGLGLIGASLLAAIQITAMATAPFTVDDNPLHATAISMHLFDNLIFDSLLASQFLIQIGTILAIRSSGTSILHTA